MYKITADGKTMVGCNEDAWRTTSKIWFENAKKENEYGACFTGSRSVGNRFAPQSGMNEVGLAYSRLTAFYPAQPIDTTGKKKIRSEVDYLAGILHTCATIKDVKSYIGQYDHSKFNDVFIYVDSSGKYLIVEPYKLIEGDEPNYVLANFCPSITNIQDRRKFIRYRNGEDFLNSHNVVASLAYCRSLSDTMHVCRNRNGDGTLLTSIWNTKDGIVNLFFYHSYDSTVQFSISEELSKGDHIYDVASMFPVNTEFQRLSNYITPFNTPPLRVSLVILGAWLCFAAFLTNLA